MEALRRRIGTRLWLILKTLGWLIDWLSRVDSTARVNFLHEFIFIPRLMWTVLVSILKKGVFGILKPTLVSVFLLEKTWKSHSVPAEIPCELRWGEEMTRGFGSFRKASEKKSFACKKHPCRLTDIVFDWHTSKSCRKMKRNLLDWPG